MDTERIPVTILSHIIGIVTGMVTGILTHIIMRMLQKDKQGNPTLFLTGALFYIATKSTFGYV